MNNTLPISYLKYELKSQFHHKYALKNEVGMHSEYEYGRVVSIKSNLRSQICTQIRAGN